MIESEATDESGVHLDGSGGNASEETPGQSVADLFRSKPKYEGIARYFSPLADLLKRLGK